MKKRIKTIFVIDHNYLENENAVAGSPHYLGKFETLEEAEKFFSGLSLLDLNHDREYIELLEYSYEAKRDIPIEEFKFDLDDITDYVLEATHTGIYGLKAGKWIFGEDWEIKTEKSFKVFEDSGGGLHLVFFEDDNCVYCHSSMEYNSENLLEDIYRIRKGANPFKDNWDNNEDDPQETYEELEDSSVLIADSHNLYFRKLGANGSEAFPHTKINELIKTFRMFKGYTQQDFASKIGITRNALQKYEYGDNVPGAVILFKIKNALDIDQELIDKALENEE